MMPIFRSSDRNQFKRVSIVEIFRSTLESKLTGPAAINYEVTIRCFSLDCPPSVGLGSSDKFVSLATMEDRIGC